MTVIDLDDYVAWLRELGVPAAHLPLYREGAEAVVRQLAAGDDELREVHVEAAVQEAAAGGASPRRQENLRAIGERLRLYVDGIRAAEEEAAAQAAAAEEEEEEEAPAEEPVLELADVPRGDSRRARLARISQSHGTIGDGSVRGTMIDDLARAEPVDATPVPPEPGDPLDASSPGPPPGPTTAPARPAVAVGPVPFTDGPRPGVLASANRRRIAPDEAPLPGCVCRARQEAYADDYWSMWGKVYLFVTGTVGFAVAMFWSRAASLAVGTGIAAIGAFATAATAGWRCTDCRRWLERKGLAAEQLRHTRMRSLVFLGIGVALSIGSVVAVQRVRAQLAEEREAMKVLDDLKALDETGD